MLSNRKPPQGSPPEIRAKADRITQVRRYRLITPFYGGGAETQKPDEVTVVRASEIRGLLRFWWRATRGGQFNGSLAKMRAAEEAIWGSAAGDGKAGPSPVSLAVRIINRGQKLRDVKTKKGAWVNIGDPSSDYGYVAFPLRQDKGSVCQGIVFELHITIHRTSVRGGGKELNVREEVEAALWAWETFGGVGARTRRGFGALQLTHIGGKPVPLLAPGQIRQDIQDKLKRYVEGGWWPDGIPHLAPNMKWVLTKPHADPDEVWRYLFGRLKTFRQDRYPDRKGRRYGRSKWPEPDAIRRITGKASPGHTPKHPVQDKFPRGRFGLPIVFHFKDKGDPPDTTLQGAQHDRFASRLILRPIACQGGAVGLACVLEGPKDSPGGYVLKQQGNGQVLARPSVKLEPDEAQEIEPLRGEPDVLKAFLKTLGWKEE
ncbi:type III-B CRISPR module RAMP protein Cmr1 [Candidatus Parcubacteria bacterium]|nr:MAG: type III-B CRISPR module RAMP protein Cmr1 [Candidatus Parcubacteria bacterium]